MLTDFFKSIDWQENRGKIVAAVVLIVVAALYLYHDYKERQEIRAHNARLYRKFLEIKKDYKFLKEFVHSFESSRWNEAVLNVQDETQILGKDMLEFENIINKTPLLDREKIEQE